MTRKEAKRMKFGYEPFTYEDIEVIIDKIYDNLEKQICKNCIHYNKDNKVCILLNISILNDAFKCKAFESKE